MGSIKCGNISLALFGESHGKGIGVVIDGLPPGEKIDFSQVALDMARRRPGKNALSTPRNEKDSVEVLSGIFEGLTTGTPITGVIYSQDTKSSDYKKGFNIPRPGHADYSGREHYKGFNDYRGGGHFSGRLTAPIVFAGSICKQLLLKKNIYVGARILNIGNIFDDELKDIDINRKLLNRLSKEEIPFTGNMGERAKEEILKFKRDGDSIGGKVEGLCINFPPGIGNPFFDSLESKISSLMFSIPGVKSIGFGLGEDFKVTSGSLGNDQLRTDGEKIEFLSNNNGGINGGISNGNPIRVGVTFKGTPSVSKTQKSIDMELMKNVDLEIVGRHDPTIVIRGLVVVESMLAIALYDALLGEKLWK